MYSVEDDAVLIPPHCNIASFESYSVQHCLKYKIYKLCQVSTRIVISKYLMQETPFDIFFKLRIIFFDEFCWYSTLTLTPRHPLEVRRDALQSIWSPGLVLEEFAEDCRLI